MALPVTHITFFGEQIDCVILESPLPAPEIQVWRTQFAGTQGVSEIVGGAGMRALDFNVVLKKKEWTTREQIQEYIDAVLNGELLGSNDTVTVKGVGYTCVYPDCTGHGFTMQRSPLQDVGGMLGINSGTTENPKYGYFCPGVLRFMQLGGG